MFRKKLEALEAELAKARKDSSTSSKPPSSDIVKPPKPHSPEDRKKRKRGGQPGHPRYLRPVFPEEQVTEFHDYHLESCPDCGGELQAGKEAPRIIQQVELVERPIRIDEHRGRPHWCPRCQKLHYALLPAEVTEAGLAGPRLTALIAYMKGACHASFSTIRKFLRDVVGIQISRGHLRNLINKVSEAMETAYQELLRYLPGESGLNVDETGHKENGERFWTWCFRAEMYTAFKIHKSRGSVVLIDVLGKEFDGVLCCDYFSAYRRYMGDCGVLVQFCLAHLIRDVKFLATLPNRATRNYGERLLNELRNLFRIIHCRETLTQQQFESRLEQARENLVTTAMSAPQQAQAQNLAKRFRLHGEAYFRFITTPGIEPTNNLAEQAIRFVVIDRRVTQGTRGETGRRWCERIWTVIASCAQQGRSVFEFLHNSFRAYLEGLPLPSLIPNTS